MFLLLSLMLLLLLDSKVIVFIFVGWRLCHVDGHKDGVELIDDAHYVLVFAAMSKKELR